MLGTRWAGHAPRSWRASPLCTGASAPRTAACAGSRQRAVGWKGGQRQACSIGRLAAATYSNQKRAATAAAVAQQCSSLQCCCTNGGPAHQAIQAHARQAQLRGRHLQAAAGGGHLHGAQPQLDQIESPCSQSNAHPFQPSLLTPRHCCLTLTSGFSNGSFWAPCLFSSASISARYCTGAMGGTGRCNKAGHTFVASSEFTQ